MDSIDENWSNRSSCKSVQIDQEEKHKQLMTNLQLNHTKIYQHLCQELNAYLNSQHLNEIYGISTGVKKYDACSYVNPDDYIHILSIKELTEKLNKTIGIILTRPEIWIESHLKQWINRSTTLCGALEILSHSLEDYQNAAVNHYYSEKSSNIFNGL